MRDNRTVIVTGASQGIGAAIVEAFLYRAYSVVATSRSISKAGFASSDNFIAVDGDISWQRRLRKSFRRRSTGSAPSTMSSTMQASFHQSHLRITPSKNFVP